MARPRRSPPPLRVAGGAVRALGGPWSAVAPDGAEAYRYGDLDDAASYARERARSTGELWRVVDGLRGPRRGPGPLPAGVRVLACYGNGTPE